MYSGLMQVIWGYRVITECCVRWPVPVPVQSFLEDYREVAKTHDFGSTAILLDLAKGRVGRFFE